MDMLNSSCKHRGPGRPRVWALGVLLAQAAVSAGAATGPQIPLCVGTTIVTAISQPDGDYESIKRIESVSPDRIRLKFSADGMVTDGSPYRLGRVWGAGVPSPAGRAGGWGTLREP